MTESISNTLGGYDIICDINSMSNLPYGWDLIYTKEGFQKYQDKKKQKSCKVGIIGNANKGKSYILQKLAGDSFPTGFSAKTEGISVKYPKSEELNFILFDTAGTETPLIKTPFYDYDQEMKEYDESIQSKQKENPDMFDLVSEDYLRKEKEYNIVETFSRDKKITEYFLQSFVIQRSDVIILVMNSMTYNEQILLNKIKKLSQKTLFVVHNLFNFVTIEQCEDYIQDTLMKSLTFKIEKLPITTFSNNSQNRNQYFYREKTSTTEGEQSSKNVVHLIMAYDDPNSEAGNYYNDVCIQFLRMQIQTVVNISPFNFQEELKKFFLNRHREFLENVFEEKDVLIEEKKIVLDEDEEGNLQQISLKKCLVDELGEETFHDNSSFEPPYSCYRTDDLKYFVIHLEVPLCKKLEASCKLIGINYVFQITGIIEVKINRKEEESIVWKRDTGRFKLRLVYPLQLMQLESRKISKLEENKGEIFIYYELKEEEKPDEEMEL